MKGLTLPLVAVAFAVGFTAAQQQTQTSQSTSQTSQGNASASSSASSSARSGGRQSASSAKGGNAAATGGSQKWTITRPTHAILYSPNPVGANTGLTVSPSLWEDQKKYYEMLGKEGKLLYAGPWREGAGAMLIVHCESDQDAQNIADEDPVVKSLMYVGNVRAWNVTYIGPWVVVPEKASQSSGTATRSGGK